MLLPYNPLRIFLPIGLVMLAAGTGKIVYDTIRSDFHLATNTLVVMFAAFQIIVIGLLADLVVRVSRTRDEVTPASVTPGNGS